MPNSGKPEFGGKGGERSEPGEGRSDFQFELREPLTPPSAPNSGLPEFGINGAQVGQARPAWGEGKKQCDRPAVAAVRAGGLGVRCRLA